jgi:hypothetical protein
MWQITLITLYCTVCQCYHSKLQGVVQRQSNNARPQFTDEEVITVYLWGMLNAHFTLKAIYTSTDMYLRKWFPKLPSYQAFAQRATALVPAFQALSAQWMPAQNPGEALVCYAIDSLPIILAKQSRSGRAKVAREFCNKTYNASRQEWYYGVKLHVLGELQPHSMPCAQMVTVSPAATADINAAKAMFDAQIPLKPGVLYADKAYCDAFWAELLRDTRQIILQTPRKKPKGIRETLVSADICSSCVSQARQPIESFFHWLDEKTGIQTASKVRSFKGLLLHIFGRLALAFCPVRLPNS